MKLSAGRFKEDNCAIMEQFNASIEFDVELFEFDVLGSLAHVKMLGACKLIDEAEMNAISEGLKALKVQHQRGELEFNIQDEDIHMNIERQLHRLIGEVAGKLHTGRSRNDQVALDLHLYLRHHLLGIAEKLCALNDTLLTMAQEHIDVIMPGYTHLQRAEPIRFSHHLLAYHAMFSRDIERIKDAFKRVNVCPLGAGALAGSGVAVDREMVAELLRFEGIYDNSLDAVSDRDFVAEMLFNGSLIMTHLSKLSEEIILWSSQEFSFIELNDQFSTGSSMMPQKKNPDVAELARGKTGRVYGALVSLLTVLKGLPLAYNKDLQEDKEGVFDTIKTLNQTLSVFTPMLASIKVNEQRMKNAAQNDYSNATQLANYLSQKGVPFRQAHQLTGEIVMHGIEKGCWLHELSLESLQSMCPLIDEAVYEVLSLEYVVDAHDVLGGTAKSQVIKQLRLALKKQQAASEWLRITQQVIIIP